MMRTRRPHLLAVDHPAVATELGPRRRSRQIRPGPRLTEQLAPGVVAGQAAAQEFLLLRVSAVYQQRRRRQPADTGLGDADRADALHLVLDHDFERRRQFTAE